MKNFEKFCRACAHLKAKLAQKKQKLGYMQEIVLDGMTVGCLKKMFGTDLTAASRFVSERYGATRLSDMNVYIYPRRQGKTFVVCFFAACILVSQVDGNVLSYHPFSHQAKMWLAQVIEFLDMFQDSAEFSWRRKYGNVSKYVEIQMRTGDEHVARVEAYPSMYQGSSNIGIGSRIARASIFREPAVPVFPSFPLSSLPPLSLSLCACSAGWQGKKKQTPRRSREKS